MVYSEISTPRCLLRGAYAEVLYCETLFAGGPYSEVLSQSALSEEPTQGAHSDMIYSKVTTPRCLLRGAFSEVLTCLLFLSRCSKGLMQEAGQG